MRVTRRTETEIPLYRGQRYVFNVCNVAVQTYPSLRFSLDPEESVVLGLISCDTESVATASPEKVSAVMPASDLDVSAFQEIHTRRSSAQTVLPNRVLPGANVGTKRWHHRRVKFPYLDASLLAQARLFTQRNPELLKGRLSSDGDCALPRVHKLSSDLQEVKFLRQF